MANSDLDHHVIVDCLRQAIQEIDKALEDADSIEMGVEGDALMERIRVRTTSTINQPNEDYDLEHMRQRNLPFVRHSKGSSSSIALISVSHLRPDSLG